MGEVGRVEEMMRPLRRLMQRFLEKLLLHLMRIIDNVTVEGQMVVAGVGVAVAILVLVLVLVVKVPTQEHARFQLWAT